MWEEVIDEKKEEEYLKGRLNRRKDRRLLDEERVRTEMKEHNGTREEIEAWPIYTTFPFHQPHPLSL